MVMKLVHWIDVDTLNGHMLSLNPNAIELLKENLNKYVYWNQMKFFGKLRKINKFK